MAEMTLEHYIRSYMDQEGELEFVYASNSIRKKKSPLKKDFNYPLVLESITIDHDDHFGKPAQRDGTYSWFLGPAL